MTQPRKRMQLADYVRELTEPHQHAEEYTTRERGEWRKHQHRTRVPSLLTQLWQNDVPSNAAEDGPRPGYQSRPAARLDALDAAVRIDLEANRWVTDLGEHAHSLDTAAVVRQLHGLVASAAVEQRREIERDVRRWWISARIVTGWDSAAWIPDNTCPICGVRGGLRVRLAEQVAICVGSWDKTGRHIECGETWGPESIGLLADHIRLESEAEKQPKGGAGPCWCPLPKPILADLSRLCPRCGSARCTHALRRRLVDTLRRGA